MLLLHSNSLDIDASAYGCVYCVFNTVNGKAYVGQTTCGNRRSLAHLKGYSCSEHLNRAVEKYSTDAFVISVLSYASNQNELDVAEIYWISHFDSIHPTFGYNSRAGGCGGHFSDEVKRKMSMVRAGFRASDETKKKMSKSFSGSGNGFFGKKHRLETIEKMRSKLS